MTRRTARVNDLIQAEISELLKRRVKDPRIGDLVTVTEVATSADLRHAKVFISVMGSEDEKRETLKCLSAASGFLRRELGERLTLRYIPELSFEQDNSIEHGAHVLRLIEQLASENDQVSREQS